MRCVFRAVYVCACVPVSVCVTALIAFRQFVGIKES